MAVAKLSPNEREAANRAEATALLIRVGYRVYRPEADVDGEDLVLRDQAGRFVPVQLKGRPTVDWPRYGGRGISMLFPDPRGPLGRPWFLVPHDTLFGWVKNRHGHARGWNDAWSYPYLSGDLNAFLAAYLLQSPRPEEQDTADAGQEAAGPPA